MRRATIESLRAHLPLRARRVEHLRSHLPTVRAVGPVLAGLRAHDHAAWLRAVRAVVHEAGSIPLAAEACGVSERALRKWIEEEPSITRGADLPGRGRPAAEK